MDERFEIRACRCRGEQQHGGAHSSGIHPEPAADIRRATDPEQLRVAHGVEDEQNGGEQQVFRMEPLRGLFVIESVPSITMRVVLWDRELSTFDCLGGFRMQP